MARMAKLIAGPGQVRLDFAIILVYSLKRQGSKDPKDPKVQGPLEAIDTIDIVLGIVDS